jgi:hypothetical protein
LILICEWCAKEFSLALPTQPDQPPPGAQMSGSGTQRQALSEER